MDMKSLVPWRRDRGSVAKPDPFEGGLPNVFGLHRQVNRLFDDFFRDFDSPWSRTFAPNWPALEVHDGEKEINIVAELPGLDEKDIDLSLREGVLTIKGEKMRKSDGAVYSERWHGQFTRSVELGPDIDPEKIEASFDKGILTVSVKKQPNPKTETKRITISNG